MIEITCTKETQNTIILALEKINECVLPEINCEPGELCRNCLMENIKWHIREGGANGD